MIKQWLEAILIMFMAAGIVQAGNIKCKKVGEWGTDNYTGVFIQGTYAYCSAEEAGLDIIDIGNPTAPKKIGNIDSLFAHNVCVNGNTKRAYLADTSELRIIDISSPSNPKLLGVYDPNLLVKNVIVNGNNAYMIGSISSPDFYGAGEFHILNVTNPGNPVLIGKYQTDVISSFYIINQYAYLTAYYYDKMNIMHSHLDIVDFANPASPQRVGVLSLDESDIKGIVVKGNYVYLGGSKLHIIDITNPTLPYLAAQKVFSGSICRDIDITGNYAYAAIDSQGLDVINISDSNAPILVKNFPTPGPAKGIVIRENFAYIADGNNGLQVLDISNPASPFITGSCGGTIAFKSLSVSGSYAYIGTSSHGLLIMDISDKNSPVPVGSYQLSDTGYYINAAQVKGNYAYILDGGTGVNRGFRVLDISNPSAPKLSGSIDSLRAEHLFVNGNYAYALGDTSGLTIIDITQPALPKIKGILVFGVSSQGIFVSGAYAYVAAEHYFMIINVDNPATPFQSASLSLNSFAQDIFVQDNYAYTVGNEFCIIDITQKNTPVVVGSCSELGYDVTVNGDYAFIAASFPGLKAIDISAPSAPTLDGTFSTPGSAQYIDADEDYVYAGDKGSGQFFIFQKSFSPYLELDKTELYFSVSSSGYKTGAQTILIDKSGSGTLNWQAVANQSWLNCTPGSGVDVGLITISVDPGAFGLAPGTYKGTVTVSAPEAGNSPQTVDVNLNVYDHNQLSGPFGDFATPSTGAAVQGSIPVTGWALDDIGVSHVSIYREEGANLIYVGDAVFIEGARPDVEIAYPGYPLNYKAGWGYMMLTNLLPGGGNGPLILHAIAVDVEGNQIKLGSKSIICDNDHAAKPFGAVDTPIQGGAASGSNFINYGWILTPQPNMIPTDGSTINVWIDGVKCGRPVYNNYRPDIASLFPNYANSDKAGGYFKFDTSAYSSGIHTLSWSAEDNAGNAEGIGSRYFSIQKNNADQAPGTTTKPWTWSHTYNLAQTGEIPCHPYEPVMVKQGFREDAEIKSIAGDEKGFIHLRLKELEPVEIRLTGNERTIVAAGFMVVGGSYRALPVGSTLNHKSAIFHWGPGLGFAGNYRLLFILKDTDGELWKKNVLIQIGDK